MRHVGGMGKELVNLLLARLGYPTLDAIDYELEQLRDHCDRTQGQIDRLQTRVGELRRERDKLNEALTRKHGELLQLQATVNALQGPTEGGLSLPMIRCELKALSAIAEKALESANYKIREHRIITDERGTSGEIAAALRGLFPRLKSLVQQMEGPGP